MEKPKAVDTIKTADEVKAVDEVFKDNEGENAGRVLGNPTNWSGSSGDEMRAFGGDGAEQDPDAVLVAELLEKADEEKRRGGAHQAN